MGTSSVGVSSRLSVGSRINERSSYLRWTMNAKRLMRRYMSSEGWLTVKLHSSRRSVGRCACR
eukprot:1664576-Amphidinium_carterae.1